MQNRSMQLLIGCLAGIALIAVLAAVLRPRKAEVARARPSTTQIMDHSSEADEDSGSSVNGSREPKNKSGRSEKDAASLAAASPAPAGKKSASSDHPTSGAQAGPHPVAPGAAGPQASGKPFQSKETSGGAASKPPIRPENAAGKSGGKTGADGKDSASASSGQSVSGATVPTPSEDSPTPAPGEAVVGGHVYQESKPISGALLNLIGQGKTLSISTTTEGFYRFAPVAAGNYVIALVKPLSSSPSRAIVLSADEENLYEDFVIPRGQSIRGTVLSEGLRKPIVGAHIIVVQGGETYRAQTNSAADGQFDTGAVEPNNYTLKINCADYQSKEIPIVVPEDPLQTLDAIEILLSSANSIRGSVVDSSGRALQGVSVGLFSITGASAYTDSMAAAGLVYTDAQGKFQLSSVPPTEDPFRLGIWKIGYVPTYGPSITLSDATQSELPALELSLGTTVTGTILNSKKQGIEKAVITVPSWSMFVNTGAIALRFNCPLPQAFAASDGSFSLSGIETGSMTLEFSMTDYITQTKTFDAKPPTVEMGEITLKSTTEGGPGTIVGEVVDELGKTYPRANCSLACTNCSQAVSQFQVADEVGGFYFKDLPDGVYKMELAASTLRDTGLWIVVNQKTGGLTPGQGFTRVLLDLGGKVKIRVVDAAGDPVRRFRADITSRAEWPSGDASYPNVTTVGYATYYEKANGEAVIQHLALGTVDLTITVEGVGVAEAKGLTVSVQEPSDVREIKVGQGGTLAGRILAEGGQEPVSGAQITALAPLGATADHVLNRVTRSSTSDDTGQFTLSAVPAGELRLRIRATGYVEKIFSGITAKENETVQVGELAIPQGGTVEGVVYNPSGAPLGDIIVRVLPALTYSDPQGRYRIEGAPAGNQTLEALDRGGTMTFREEISVVAGSTVVKEIHLQAK